MLIFLLPLSNNSLDVEENSALPLAIFIIVDEFVKGNMAHSNETLFSKMNYSHVAHHIRILSARYSPSPYMSSSISYNKARKCGNP